MTPWERLRAGVILLVLVVVVGSVGFMLIEDLDLLEAVYMTIITVSTVGFRELVRDPSTAGRILTMFVIVAGTGAALYTAVTALELGLETFFGGSREHKRMTKAVEAMDGHIILCGFGRVGRNIWTALVEYDQPVVVIDNDPASVAAARELGALVVEGDATADEVLEQAGIDRARTLIAAVQSDSDNLVIVLSSKARNRQLTVLARAAEAESQRKLVLAGADRVVAPQVVGANRLAALAVQPELADIIDLVVSGRLVQFRVAEMVVDDGAEIVGRSLRDIDLRSRSGALVIAIDDGHGRLTLNPDPGVVIRPGQTVIGVGTEEQLAALGRLVHL
jgi:voltage-gated potassium channel